MKKIIIISDNDPKDKQARSGVIYSIYNQLSKYNDTIWIKPQFNAVEYCIYKILKGIVKILNCKGYGVTNHNPFFSKIICHAINRKIKDIDYDAIFSFDCINIAYLDTNKPIYYRSDSLYHLLINYYMQNTPTIFIKWGDIVEQKALQKITTMFAPSRWIIEGIKKYYPTTDLNKIKFIESGANIQNELIPNLTKSYDDIKVLNMLFIGFDLKRKGIDIAYQTLQILNSKYKINSTLTIIGGIPENNILNDKRVNYLGKLNKNNPEQAKVFYKAFEQASLFIFPTKAEFHGIVNCEACAFSLPIFSYDTGGVSSYVLNNLNGNLLPINATAVDFAKKISEAFINNKLKEYSLNARNLYKTKFNWDVWGEKTNKIINHL